MKSPEHDFIAFTNLLVTERAVNQTKKTAFETIYKYMKKAPNFDTFLGRSLFMKSTINNSTKK